MFRRFALSIAIITTARIAQPAFSMSVPPGEVASCSTHSAKTLGCLARVKVGPGGKLAAQAAPAGYSPAQLRAAYNVPAGSSARVAVVTAYGDPTAKADLDTYSRTFGLPVLPNCASAAQTGCFEKTDQHGGQKLPKTNAGWAMETALDVESIHGMCPGCRIELVEASSASQANLVTAVDQAVASGAHVISMSWGGSESTTETSNDQHFAAPATIFIASSGDSGYGTSWPAASSKVVAVGGTTLMLGAAGRVSETAWSGSGSGCSKYEAKPSWQHDQACARRSVGDIAADADPATGAAIYSGTNSSGAGWYTIGGTSLAAPLIAGMIGVGGGPSLSNVMPRLYASGGTNRLFDIQSGTTGKCSTYLCKAGAGYDGPTGLGTLNGLGAL